MELRIFTEPQQGATYDQLLAVARTAERLGFAAFFRSDHILRMGADTPAAPVALGPTETWSTLAGIARETSTIRLGTLVTAATFRHPSMLALQVATVDQMSGGRVELGLGTGWYANEHTAYGLAFPPLGERFEILGEQLAIIDGMWRTPVGETFSFAGKHYTLTDSPAMPKTVQSPRPPIVIGGGGPKKTPALAARYAQDFNVAFRPVAATAEQFDRVRAAVAGEGRPADSMVYSVGQVVVVGEDEAQFADRAARVARRPEDLRVQGVAGTIDEALTRIGEFAAIGATRMYLQFLDLPDLEHLELIGEQILPFV